MFNTFLMYKKVLSVARPPDLSAFELYYIDLQIFTKEKAQEFNT